MTTPKNSINSRNPHAPNDANQSTDEHPSGPVNTFIQDYNSRMAFFSNSFIARVKDGNRKALAELQQRPFPPTPMDLRSEFSKCLKMKIPDDRVFHMGDGKIFTMKELRRLVPEWASIAEKSLMESDPVPADKLMSPAQWNAKAAFEVTFTNAMNELKEIRKNKQANTFHHYEMWILNPLTKAMEHVKAVSPPSNCLIGYGERIPLKDALTVAAKLPQEFKKVVEKMNR